MKLNFTTIVFALLSLLSVGIMNAQNINVMTVTSNGMDTEYNFGLAAFGNPTLEISAGAILGEDGTDPVNDACEALVNDVTAQIAVVDRGSCAFVNKVRNAQAAGAVAVVICNSELDPQSGADISDTAIIPGGGSDPTDDITVLTVGISYNSCQTLKMNMADGPVTITFDFLCPAPTYGPEIIWGANGEGAFDGGLNGWSVDKGTGLNLEDGGWFFDREGRLDRGAFGAGLADTPTACNGVMLFDSDFYDTAGEADGAADTGFNDGVCISDAAAGIYCEGLLISPEIDLAAVGSSGGFRLSWSQSLRHFQSQYFVLLSRDGGMTFSDTITVNDDIPVNETGNGQRSITLCGYNDAANFRFAFLYRGAFYYWAIDDVIIEDIGDVSDIRVNDSWASKYPNIVSPSGQYEEMVFMIDLENIGVSTSTGNTLTVDVLNLTTLTEAYRETLDYDDITCGVTPENVLISQNQVLPMSWTPTEDGTYRVTYTVDSESDTDPGNNSWSYDFTIGGDTFRKTIGPEDGGTFSGIAPAGQSFYTYANVYRVSDGAGKRAISCNYGFTVNAGTAFNGIITADLYKWRDLNNNGRVDGAAPGPSERVLIGQSSLIVSSQTGQNYDNIEFVFDNVAAPGESIKLEDNTDYVVAVHTRPIGNADVTFFGRVVNGGVDRDVDFQPTNFAFTQLLPDGEARSVGSFLATGLEGDEDDRSFGPLLFNDGNGGADAYAAYIPLTIGEITTDTEDLVNDQSISVFPNPVSEVLFVDMNLGNTATDVNLELVDIQGKVIATKNYNSISGRIEMNVATIPTGLYYLNVRTEEGLTSKKVIIQK